jgi:FAD/FMN-containing dehydrogenase
MGSAEGAHMTLDRRHFVRSALAATAAATPAARLWADTAAPGVIPDSLDAVTGDGKAVTLHRPDIKDLRAALKGQLLLANDAGYDTVRRIYNPDFDRHPALIARCAVPQDVVQAVNFARAHGLLVAVRSGGHSFAGYSTCNGGLMIDLLPMHDVRVDAGKRLAWVQGGSLLGPVDRATQAVGLATTMGTAADTGVGGLTTGGGAGRLMGKFGLAIDNLQAVEIVTADGRLLHASETQNPDLFWGVRGGGGNFGIVTTFEFRLHPFTSRVLSGAMVFPFERANEVFAAMSEITAHAPDEFGNLGILLQNSSPSSGQPGRTAVFLVDYMGDPATGEKLLAPIRRLGKPLADAITAMSYLQAQGDTQSAASAAIPSGKTNVYEKSGFMRNPPSGYFDEVRRHFETLSPSMDYDLFLGPVIGAVTRVAPTATAYWNRGATHIVMIHSEWTDPAQRSRGAQTALDLWSGVERFTQGYYVNASSDATDPRLRTTYGDNYPRLVRIKSQYDPRNLFRLNANIKPAGA